MNGNDVKKFTDETRAAINAWLETPETKDAIEAITKAESSETGTFEVVITTEDVDRYGEVIKLDGWALDHYMKNPVVLWGHDHFTPPIGVATSIERQDGKLVAKGKFAPHAFAQEIRASYDAGIIRATSVGFIEHEREGNFITKAELIEFSFVSVPANPYALSLAMEKGLSIDALVTKGLMTVQKDTEEPKEEVPAPVEPPVTTEKQLSTKALVPIIEQMKTILGALEDMAKSHEPEGTDEEDEPVVPPEDEKGFKEFSEKRRIIQEAATIFGDVLAEARRAIEAQK